MLFRSDQAEWQAVGSAQTSKAQQLTPGLPRTAVRVVHCPKVPVRDEPKLKSGSRVTRQILQQIRVPRVSAFISYPAISRLVAVFIIAGELQGFTLV